MLVMGGEPLALNPTAMDNEYYSLEAIIAENQVSIMTKCGTVSLRMQQKIECTFDLDVPELGYLDNGTDENVGKRCDYISK
jgi:GINS complex subunit 3